MKRPRMLTPVVGRTPGRGRHALVFPPVFAVLAALLAACTPPEGPAPPTVDLPALQQALAGDHPPLILDVRTPGEFAQGHLAGAVNLPHYALSEEAAAARLPRDREVVVLCEAGVRSRWAGTALQQMGYRVREFSGGMSQWRSAGGEISRGS